MSVSLQKGGRLNLSREVAGLSKVMVGLGWDTNSSDTGAEFDLDASAFLLGANGKIANDRNFVFYNNLQSADNAVNHTGDNRTGEGEGDDESIEINFSKLSSDIKEIVIVVTIHEASARRQNFGMVRNAFMRLVNQSNDKEIARYDLEEDFSTETAVEFGRLYLKDGEWRFNAVGTGFNGGLSEFCKKFGVDVD